MNEDRNPKVYGLTEKDYPAIKKYEVGGTYNAIVKCKIVDKHLDSDGKLVADAEILKIKPVEYGTVDKVKSLMKY